jgi:hypothetical protein
MPKNLLAWYLKTGAREAKRISTVAMKIGNRVDELIQEDVREGKYSLSNNDSLEVKNCMEAWEKFKNDYKPNITNVQVELKDQAKKIIGHLDLVIDNKIVDVKCASSIKPNYWLQLAAYVSMFPCDNSEFAILRFDKSLGTYQFVNNKALGLKYNYLIRVFDGLLEAYRFYNNKPKGLEEE